MNTKIGSITIITEQLLQKIMEKLMKSFFVHRLT